MTSGLRLIAAAVAACAGCWMFVSGARQRRPPLARMVAHLSRPAAPHVAHRRGAAASFGRLLLRGRTVPAGLLADLRLVQVPPEVHAVRLVVAATAGLFAPSLILGAAQLLGLVSLGFVVPVGVALAGAIVAPLAVHSAMRARAATIRTDLRHQLSAYLDVVTMLLAGNVGNEGALRQAAQTGDGRLFVELRRRILVAETSNRSLVSALGALGRDLDLVEMRQIAASAALGSAAGAPVARSLAAKCASLRNTLAAEQEAEARVRTGRITIPLVGMSLLIMAAVIYPALNVN